VGLLLRLLALALLAVAGCTMAPWNDSQQAEAIRMCRSQFGFPPISVFESHEVVFVRKMCQCEVEYLSTRVPHRQFEDRLQANEVNRILQVGGAACLEQLGEHRP
jgi:hypothetical protein